MDDRRQPLSGLGGLGNTALIEKSIVLILFLAFAAGVLMVLLPFGIGLLFGGVIAISTWPLREWMRRAGLSPGVSATLLLIGLLAFVAIPVLLLAPRLVGDVTRVLDVVRVWLQTSPPPPVWLEAIPFVGDNLKTHWVTAIGSGASLTEVLAPYAETLRSVTIAVARGMGESLVQLLLALAIATMFWAQGDTLALVSVDVLRRLGGDHLAKMAGLSVNAVRGVFYGVVGTACVQAGLMAIGCWAVGIPGAVPIGFITLLLALSQIGGPLIHLVWAGGVYWLYLQGQAGLLLWLFAGWGVFVSFIDNILKPWLIGASIEMPLALVILGVFGGFLSFGFLGLFVGPVLIAVAYALLVAWRAQTGVGDRPVEGA
ncbi:MAG: AI-2E family transporter [Beijerinckiaceae bacterium]|nr:AI-2E family transporter [Beijerinckiaceae bacterium]